MMTKAIRANVKLSERKAAGIIAELARWKDGELGTKLTWERIEAFSGFTRQALSRHPQIVTAYQMAKGALATPDRRSRSRARNEELLYLDHTIEELRAELRRYELLERKWFERWQCIAYHCLRRGLSIEEFDQPIDTQSRR
ncbi:hypothetical protein [Caballeronia sordidicola]|uniref:hypothetical protein n=1 Tax=Caballeronia sordidicola TaxID=196367 RepID=UPI00211A4529|nr:hypothetical protein [Caballeronia sordidicola]